jgi:hypothetical protein
MMSAPDPPLSCDRCAAGLHRGRGDFYLVSIVAIADPSPPTFTEAELARDLGREINLLLESLEGLGELEAVDQVYRRKILHLCTPCYQRWIDNPTGS